MPLQRARVLELVDQHVAHARVEPLLHPARQRAVAQQRQRATLQVGHVGQAARALERGVRRAAARARAAPCAACSSCALCWSTGRATFAGRSQRSPARRPSSCGAACPSLREQRLPQRRRSARIVLVASAARAPPRLRQLPLRAPGDRRASRSSARSAVGASAPPACARPANSGHRRPPSARCPPACRPHRPARSRCACPSAASSHFAQLWRPWPRTSAA